MSQFRHEWRRVHRPPAAREIVPAGGVEAGHGVGFAVRIHERAEGVVADGHIHDALGVLLAKLIQGAVDVAQPLSGHLVGHRHDSGKLRRGFAGPTDNVVARPGAEAPVHHRATVNGRTQADVWRAAMVADDLANAVLEVRAPEHGRYATATGTVT